MTETLKHLYRLTDDDTSFHHRQQMIAEVNAAICLEKHFKKPILINGKTIARSEIIEALREIYRDACEYNSQIPGHMGNCRFPDVEAVLDHIDENGLSPKHF